MLGALAVSFSVMAMHFTKTIHPPDGATALIAVIGSSEVHNAGHVCINANSYRGNNTLNYCFTNK